MLFFWVSDPVDASVLKAQKYDSSICGVSASLTAWDEHSNDKSDSEDIKEAFDCVLWTHDEVFIKFNLSLRIPIPWAPYGVLVLEAILSSWGMTGVYIFWCVGVAHMTGELMAGGWVALDLIGE